MVQIYKNKYEKFILPSFGGAKHLCATSSLEDRKFMVKGVFLEQKHKVAILGALVSSEGYMCKEDLSKMHIPEILRDQTSSYHTWFRIYEIFIKILF